MLAKSSNFPATCCMVDRERSPPCEITAMNSWRHRRNAAARSGMTDTVMLTELSRNPRYVTCCEGPWCLSLARLKPPVVMTLSTVCWFTMQAAWSAPMYQ